MTDGGNCSFCGKSSHEVFRLIAGPTCSICSECVGIACNMIADEYRKFSEPLRFPPPPHRDDQP